MSAKTRYDSLSSNRSQFLNTAEEAAKLTIPYLIRGEEDFYKSAKSLSTPWQSVGAKGVRLKRSKKFRSGQAALGTKQLGRQLQIKSLNI